MPRGSIALPTAPKRSRPTRPVSADLDNSATSPAGSSVLAWTNESVAPFRRPRQGLVILTSSPTSGFGFFVTRRT